MARLSFPTNRRVAAPLLIDAAQLGALDEVVDRYEGALRERRDKEIRDLTEREIQRRLTRGILSEDQIESRRARIRDLVGSRRSEESRSVVLYLRGGREVQAGRFSEAINQPIGAEEFCTGLRLHVRVGSVRATVSVADEELTRELIVDVEPNENDVAQEFFGALNNWCSDVEAPKWQQTWVRFRNWLWFPLVLGWIIFGVAFPLSNWSDAGKNATKTEARKLLSDGITPANQLRALSLVLALESDFSSPNPSGVPVGLRYWSFFLVGCAVLACLGICPQACIGVWKGKQRLLRWRGWITAMTVTIPLLLVGSLVIPWVLHLLGIDAPVR